MDHSPQDISTQSFAIVKKGYDPAAVRSYLTGVSKTLEASQQQATAMEARARAAVAKLQELSQAGESAAAPAAPTGPTIDESETISRTLLLAQRTADSLIAEARAEADTMVNAARAEATGLVSEAQRQADSTIESSKLDGRKSYESERTKAESEVQALLARRDFLVGDVEQLEAFVDAHRQRLLELATTLQDAGASGLGELRRPLLSAAADTPGRAGGDSGATESTDDGDLDDDLDEIDEELDEDRSASAADDVPTEAISSLAGLVDVDPEPAGATREPTPTGTPKLLDFDGKD